MLVRLHMQIDPTTTTFDGVIEVFNSQDDKQKFR
jgi:hypothetical protein